MKKHLKTLASQGRKTFLTTLSEKLKAKLHSEKLEAEKALEKKGEAPAEEVLEPQEEQGLEAEAKAGAIEKGSLCRCVVEKSVFKRLLGLVGKVADVVDEETVKVAFPLEAHLGIAPILVPACLLEVELAPEHKAPELKTMLRQSRWLKKQLLEAAGVSDPEKQVVTALKVGDQAAEDHLDLFGSAVQWSLGLSESTKVKVVPASLSLRILCDARGLAVSELEPLPSPEVVEKRLNLLRAWVERFETLLVPIYSKGVEGLPKHWTLLCLRTEPGGRVLEYFDSLQPRHLPCSHGAITLLRLVGLGDLELRGRTNESIQSSDDCGWFVCHYLEEYLRREAGDPKQSQGWPSPQRLSKLQGWLRRLIISLELEREKWCQDLKAEAEKEEELEAKLRELSVAYLRRKGLLSRAVELHMALSQELLEAGAAEEPPPLDASFVQSLEAYRNLLKERRAKRKEVEAALPPPPAPPPLEEPPALEGSRLLEGPAAVEGPAALEAEAGAMEGPPAVEPALGAMERPAAIEGPAAVEAAVGAMEGPAALEAAALEDRPPLEQIVAELVEKCSANKDMDLFEAICSTAKIEDLSPSQQAHMRKVELEGKGVCSKCRWLTGCLNCDLKKAWKHCLKSELGILTRAKGEPKKKATGGGAAPALEDKAP